MRLARIIALITLVAAAASPLTADEVEGMERFRGSEEARRMVLEQGFVVTDETYRNICSFYKRENEPFFITTDSALFAYNVILEDALRKLEYKQAERLKALTAGYLQQLETYKDDRPEWRRAADDLRDYFLVADALAAGKTSAEETKNLPAAVRDEIALVLEAEKPAASPLRGIPLNYALCKPAGFYTEDDPLSTYYRARAWVTNVPFHIADDHETRQAFILALLTNEELGGLLRGLQYPYWEFAGAEGGNNFHLDNPPITVYKNAFIEAVYISGTLHGNLNVDKTGWEYFKNEINKYPDPKYTSIPTAEATLAPSLHKGLRLLNNPRDIGNESLSLLFPAEIIRDPVSGEEYMALLGSTAARGIVMEREGKTVAGYAGTYANAEKQLPNLIAAHRGFLWEKRFDVYQDLLETPTDLSLPAFYLEPAWRYKDLNTALSGWSQQTYTWGLYTGIVEGGVGGIKVGWEPPPAYIEPNEAFFNDLLRLSIYTDLYFAEYGVEDSLFNPFTVLLTTLTGILDKQLTDNPLTATEKAFLKEYGFHLSEAVYPGEPSGDKYLPDTPFCTPVALNPLLKNERLVGQTRPRKIYVLCEDNGKTYLTIGGVMTYADHVGPAWGPGKMDNDEWKARAAKGEIQPPAWEKAFSVAGAKKQQHLEVDYAPLIGDEQICGKP